MFLCIEKLEDGPTRQEHQAELDRRLQAAMIAILGATSETMEEAGKVKKEKWYDEECRERERERLR